MSWNNIICPYWKGTVDDILLGFETLKQNIIQSLDQATVESLLPTDRNCMFKMGTGDVYSNYKCCMCSAFLRLSLVPSGRAYIGSGKEAGTVLRITKVEDRFAEKVFLALSAEQEFVGKGLPHCKQIRCCFICCDDGYIVYNDEFTTSNVDLASIEQNYGDRAALEIIAQLVVISRELTRCGLKCEELSLDQKPCSYLYDDVHIQSQFTVKFCKVSKTGRDLLPAILKRVHLSENLIKLIGDGDIWESLKKLF